LEKLGHPKNSFREFRIKELDPVGFAACINVSCEVENFEADMKLLEAERDVFGAFGLHPHNAKDWSPQVEEFLRRAMAHEKVRAFGEIGLDYHYNLSPPDVQRDVFAKQLRLAVELEKPIVVHTREAEEDTLRIMNEAVPANWPVHVHCFTSSLQLAKALAAHFPQLCFGFTGVVTFNSARDVQEVVKALSLDRLLLETDGPYMAPVPHRGKVCHSGHIPLIARKIAALKDVPLEELYTSAARNAARIYNVRI
jgi:TatD DNase family protein